MKLLKNFSIVNSLLHKNNKKKKNTINSKTYIGITSSAQYLNIAMYNIINYV